MSGPLSRRALLAGVAGATTLGVFRALKGDRQVASLSLPPFLARPTTESILITARNGAVDATARLEVKQRGPAP